MYCRGENAPPLENKELDEFVPEVGAVFQQLQISIWQVNNETESFLATALSYVQRKDTEEDTSLTAGMAIPSHEEVNRETLGSITCSLSQVEFESPAHGNPEVDLLPVAALALDHRLEELLHLAFNTWLTGWKMILNRSVEIWWDS